MHQQESSGPTTGESGGGDRIAPARGIMLGLVLAVPVWVGIGLIIWLLVKISQAQR
jgi:hypothetical protein